MKRRHCSVEQAYTKPVFILGSIIIQDYFLFVVTYVKGKLIHDFNQNINPYPANVENRVS
jgi:hypothetical protein